MRASLKRKINLAYSKCSINVRCYYWVSGTGLVLGFTDVNETQLWLQRIYLPEGEAKKLLRNYGAE